MFNEMELASFSDPGITVPLPPVRVRAWVPVVVSPVTVVRSSTVPTLAPLPVNVQVPAPKANTRVAVPLEANLPQVRLKPLALRVPLVIVTVVMLVDRSRLS